MNAIVVIPLLLALGQAEGKPVPAAPSPSPAASAEPGGAPLTLDEALSRAVDANFDLAQARAKLQQARQGVWKAWSGYLPQVTVGGSWTRNAKEIPFALPVAYHVVLDGPGATTGHTDYPTQVLDAELVPKTQLAGQVQATQALLVPALWGMISAATHGTAAAEHSVEAARREILFGVSQLFNATASLKKVLDVQQRLYDVAKKHERDAEVRYKAGTVPKVAFLRAQIERARAEQDLLRSRNGYESIRLALANALDRKPDFEVVDPGEPALPADLSALEEQALRDRPDVKAAREAEAAARGQRFGVAGKYLPSLAAFGRYVYTDPPGLVPEKQTWAVGLGLNWNVFDGGLREAELREANARIDEAEAARKGAEARARLEVRQASLDLESARANAKKAAEQRELARENQRLIDVSFNAGAATALEQADAQTALRGAEVAFEAEELSARLSALRLLKAAGAFDPAAARR
jgi:outer membrane protein TolC